MNNIIKTTVISPEEAARDGFYKWVGAKNDCEYHGLVSGYWHGFCVEVKNVDDGRLDYCSVTFIGANDSTDIMLPELDDGSLADMWNSLGISASIRNGKWIPTGRIVFRGYYNHHWDWEERDDYYTDASEEVEALFRKYVVA